MELGIYLTASLLGAGYLMNQQKQPRNLKYKTDSTEKIVTNGTNIYNSTDFHKVQGEEARLVRANFEASKNPISTNIIPMYYNTLHLTHQNIDKVSNPNYNKDLIYSVLDSFDEQTTSVIAAKKNLAPSRVINRPNAEWDLINGHESAFNVKNLAEQGTLDQIGGSLLPNRGSEDFTHNNMVPFYGGRLKQNMSMDNRLSEQKLESYTGQFKLNMDQKQERGPLFAPTTGISNIYGNVEKRDMSRYIPSVLGKKNNELPFEQEIVGPGLNKGFTATPSGGFHDTLRIMPKPTEDLRIDPIFEQEGRINPGRAPTAKRALIQQLYKNKPDLFVENKKGERNFTTVGAVTGRAIRPSMMLRDTNRKESRVLMAAAKIANGGQSYVPGKVKKSSKVNFLNTVHRNAVLATGKKINDFGKDGYHNKLNERVLTGSRSHVLNPKTWVNAIKSYFKDSAKKTRKQHYINNPRPNGNVKTQRPSALPAYDPDQVAKTTIRETTENAGHNGFIAHVGGGKGPAYDPTQLTKTTIRETTENKKHKGFIAKIGAGKTPAYDPSQITKTTIRETTENKKHKGFIAKIGAGKTPAYDPSQITKTTIRETTENTGHTGFIAKIGAGKTPAYDPSQVTKTTIRETTENNKHKGHVNSRWKKHIAYDPDQVARTTIKETTENKKHKGWLKPIGPGKGPAYSTTPDAMAKPTVRETTENNDHLGNVGTWKKHVAYDPNQVAKTTIRETTEQDEHVGIAGPTIVKKHIVYDPSQVAKTTIKETTEQDNHVGIVGPSVVKKHKTYDPTQVAKTTIKETTEQDNHLPGANRGALQNGKAYMTTNWYVNNTNRQFTGDFEYTGVANANAKKLQSYEAGYNTEVNTEKEVIAKGRAPAKQSIKVTNGAAQINMQINKIEDDRLNMRSAVKNSNACNYFNPSAIAAYTTTSEKNRLPQDDTRLDTTILDAFKRNPLTQSLHSYY